MGGSVLWRQILVSRYGKPIGMMAYFQHLRVPNFDSIWWKDLCCIGSWGSKGQDWISDNSRVKVEDDTSALFWHDV